MLADGCWQFWHFEIIFEGDAVVLECFDKIHKPRWNNIRKLKSQNQKIPKTHDWKQNRSQWNDREEHSIQGKYDGEEASKIGHKFQQKVKVIDTTDRLHIEDEVNRETFFVSLVELEGEWAD